MWRRLLGATLTGLRARAVALRREETASGLLVRHRARRRRPTRLEMIARAVKPNSWTRRVVVRIAWPIAASNVLDALTLAVDLVMVGSLGVVALAAMGLASELFLFGLAVAVAFGAGATALVARATGADDQEGVDRAATGALVLALAASIPLAALAYFGAAPLMFALSPDTEVAVEATVALRVLAFGIPGLMVSSAVSGAFEGAGDTRPGLVIGLTANVLNLAADWVLIYGHFGAPALDIQGAALATVGAFSASALAYVVLLARRRRAVGLALRDLRLRKTSARLLSVGGPTSASEVVIALGIIAYLAMILRFGADALAGHQIGLQVQSIAQMAGLGFTAAAAALVGQWLGKGDPDEAEANGWVAIALAVGLAVAVGIPLFFLAPHLAGIFTDSADATTWGALAILMTLVALPPLALHYTVEGALIGAGDTRFPLGITFAGLWLVRLPLAWLFGVTLGLGVFGAWLAFVVDYYARAAATTARFVHGAWKRRQVPVT